MKKILKRIFVDKITRKNLDEFLEKYATTKKVLDIGSGGSSYDRFFPNRLMVDIDPERNPDIVADAHDLPFDDASFEFILCTEMLEHVKNPRKVVSELNRVLEPNGTLILTTRFIYPLHDVPHDYWRFTKYGLKELFSNWEIIELKPETKTFSAFGALLQRLCYQTKLRANIFVKTLLFLLAWVFNHLNFLVTKEFGDIKKSSKDNEIFTTGYYLVTRKD